MQIFISYAREDLSAAKRLFDHLKEMRDVIPWLDKESLLPGEEWERSIMVALEESNFMISLLSKNSVDKTGFVQKEVQQGLKRYALFPAGKVYLIPARLDDSEPANLELRKLNWVDLFPDWDDGVRRIDKVIERERQTEKKRAQETLREFSLSEEPELRISSSSLEEQEIRDQLKAGKALVGANLMYADLRSLNLRHVSLEGANLVGADLTDVDLTGANLKGANLERANLCRADLRGANLWGVNLWRAKMQDVRNLSKVDSLQYANFFHVKGLSKEDKVKISTEETTSLGDYGVFIKFFLSDVGMSAMEIKQVFLWTQHEYFQSIVQLIM
jgi:uncharacterized protein YjbI with pentapeptide repeats